MKVERETLPDLMYTDWIEGYENKYVIVSLKRSTLTNGVLYWKPNECGYTPYLMCALFLHQDKVSNALDRYNDGLSTIAVPCTDSYFKMMGLVNGYLSEENIDRLLTVVRKVDANDYQNI